MGRSSACQVNLHSPPLQSPKERRRRRQCGQRFLPGSPVTSTRRAGCPAQLEGATHVYVLNGSKPAPLSPPHSGPYVVWRRGPKSFDIFIGGRLETVSVDRLKLHRGRAVPVLTAPPVHSRPRRV